AMLAAVSLACGGRARRVVHLPVPEAEHVAVGPESRPGLWLSPGDGVHWSLPAGPARRLTAAYMTVLAGDPAGSLRIRISGAGRPGRSSVVTLSADPARWHPVSLEIPRSREPIELEIAYENPGSWTPPRSLFLAEPSYAVPARDPPRTIVLFDVDSLRADHVGAYGYLAPTTPRSDRFFRDGLRAEKCVAAANWTLPAHASMFTSETVAHHDAGRSSMALADRFDTLAESFAAAGYRTVAVTGGGLVHPSFGLAQGFDRYVSASESAGEAVRRSLDLLREYRNEPVFLFFHTYQVHEYVGDREAAGDLFGGVPALGPDWRSPLHEWYAAHSSSPEFRVWARHRYDAALRSVDAAFGRLLDGLEREGRLSRTAILLTADHGEALCDRIVAGSCLAVGHATPYLFEEELLVPFEVRVPWMPKARGVIRGNASELDVAPTLLDAAGVKAPAAFEGRSLLASPPPAGRSLVSEAPPLDALAVRIGDHKLIRRAGVPQKFWASGGEFVVFPVQQSFDLSSDPGERTPLASASDWGRELLAEVDRYLASGFPDALIVRFPRSPEQEGRSIVVSALGRGPPPSLRSFGLAAQGVVTQRGARTEIRFRRPRAPFWLAFQPDESRAVALRIEGAGPLASAAGGPLGRGTYSWTGLGWAGRERLPGGPEAVIFTTPQSPRRPRVAQSLPSDAVTQLLSLGYLPFSAPPEERPAAAGGEPPDASLAAGEVRIDHAD
ncbi:MAG TPA: sulfatase, partial [Thermoanaerobaculia bacterium]|nr:sulfatase [Thermoanaerobaculia bacterium]